MALCGTFGYELDPGKLTQEEKEAVKAQVADYHKYYDRYGDFYRITSPTEDPYLGLRSARTRARCCLPGW